MDAQNENQNQDRNHQQSQMSDQKQDQDQDGKSTTSSSSGFLTQTGSSTNLQACSPSKSTAQTPTQPAVSRYHAPASSNSSTEVRPAHSTLELSTQRQPGESRTSHLSRLFALQNASNSSQTRPWRYDQASNTWTPSEPYWKSVPGGKGPPATEESEGQNREWREREEELKQEDK